MTFDKQSNSRRIAVEWKSNRSCNHRITVTMHVRKYFHSISQKLLNLRTGCLSTFLYITFMHACNNVWRRATKFGLMSHYGNGKLLGVEPPSVGTEPFGKFSTFASGSKLSGVEVTNSRGRGMCMTADAQRHIGISAMSASDANLPTYRSADALRCLRAEGRYLQMRTPLLVQCRMF